MQRKARRQNIFIRWMALLTALLLVGMQPLQPPPTVFANAPFPDTELFLIQESSQTQSSTSLQPVLSGNFRWLDVADQPYSVSYRSGYDYSHAQVELTYATNAPTFQGTLIAQNLKPNFAYQMKLEGLSGTSENECIGLSGRWWEEEWSGISWYNGRNLNNKGDGAAPNPNDEVYFSHRDELWTADPPIPRYKHSGYLVLAYFVTDENGDATAPFTADSSYHVLWKVSQRPHSVSDGPLITATFDADASDAYDDSGGDDFPLKVTQVFGEWERLPVGGVTLRSGNYAASLFLTEESFHGSGGSFAGVWAAAMYAPVSFAIAGDAVAPEPMSTSISGADLTLAWPANPANAAYKLYQGTAPYFDPVPPADLGPLSPYTQSITIEGAVGDGAANYFYVVRALNCSGETARSATIGVFAFSLVAGRS